MFNVHGFSLALAQQKKMSTAMRRAMARDPEEVARELLEKSLAEKWKRERVCRERGHHDLQEFIDPKAPGFDRCKDCGLDVERPPLEFPEKSPAGGGESSIGGEPSGDPA